MAFIVTVVDFERVNVSWEASPEISQPRGMLLRRCFSILFNTFWPSFLFSYLWCAFSFLTFSGDIEMEQWATID